MKKNLIIVVAAMIVAAMVVPASAAQLTLSGKYSASFTYDWTTANTEFWSPTTLADASTMRLNLTFKEGDAITAYLPLYVKPFIGSPSVSVDPDIYWYFSYAADPINFWVSDNNAGNGNPKVFAPLGDPLGIGAEISSSLVGSLSGKVLGTDVTMYAADLGVTSEVTNDNNTPDVGSDDSKSMTNKGNGFLARVVAPLPSDFKLGVVTTLVDGQQTITTPATGENADNDNTPIWGTPVALDLKDDLTVGVDVTGKIPGLDADLTLAGAGYFWWDDATKKFEHADDNLAYQAKVENLALGPVTAKASYTTVQDGFFAPFRSTNEDVAVLLRDYKGYAAAEAEVKAEVPVGLPLTLTVGDGLWMDSADNALLWNETTGSAEAEVLTDLKATVSGAYRVDLREGNPESTADDGYRAKGSVEYKAFGLTLTPYVEYKKGYYGVNDSIAKDEVVRVGAGVTGTPATGLEVTASGAYAMDTEDYTKLTGDVYALYTTEIAPSFMKSAKSQAAALAEYVKASDGDPDGYLYLYAGSEFTVDDKLSGVVGILNKDEKDGLVATAKLTYAMSDKLSLSARYTYRGAAIEPDPDHTGEWRPLADNHYVQLGVTGTVGTSTIGVTYGSSGLNGYNVEDVYSDSVHAGKPWSYLYLAPSFMNWQKVTVSLAVPF